MPLLATLTPFTKIRPYVELSRLQNPIGIWLIFIPGYLGMVLGHEGIPPLSDLLYIFAGAVVTRSLGCVLNDFADQNLDKKVERTKSRPLASGALSQKQALIFASLLIFCALALVAISPMIVVQLSAIGFLLIAIYPWMKRITYWPQAFLGLAMNFSALMGFAYVREDLTFPALVLFVALFFWTLFYDTIYAYQDIDDDLKVGIKSSAIALWRLKSENSTDYFSILCVVMILSGFIFLGMTDAPMSFTMSISFLCCLAAFFLVQIWYFDSRNKPLCNKLFRQQKYAGILMVVYLLSLYQ